MDLQIGIFCLVIASLSSFVIYIVLSISPFKEGSFEEAKANRRKIIKQYQDQSKTGVDKGKEKKLKKNTKKSKKNEADDDVSSNKEIAAQKNEADVVEDKEVKKIAVKSEESRTHVQESKKINKGEKSKKPVSNDAVATAGSSAVGNPSNTQSKPVAKQNVEKLSSSKSSKRKADEVSSKNRGEDDAPSTSSVMNEEPPRELVVQPQQEVVVKHAAKPSKKKRSEISTLHQLSNEREAVNINLLVSLVQKAELSRTEIQLLIDALLNKQQEDISEWLKGRQDPQVKLQKQLTELEEALKDEKQISAGFQAKLKELRNELNADKASARHNEELIVTMQNDCKTLSVKLQQTIEENQVLATKIQQYQKQLADEQLNVRKLKDEQGIQQQITEKQCHEAVISLQAQVNQYAAQSQELQVANNSLRAEIAMLQENDLRIQEEYREVNANLERALSAATFDANTARNELTNMEHALSDARADIENLGGSMSALKLENERINEQNQQYLDQCSILTKEVETLSEKLSENLENGYSSNNKQDIADYETRLKESDSLLKSLENEIEAKDKIIEDLNSVVSSTKNECQKTKSSLDKATKEISLLTHKMSSEVSKSDHDEVTQLKNIVNDKNREMANLMSELETSKSRNNELRHKNWKVVEALTRAEQSLQNKILSDQRNNEIQASSSDDKVKTWIHRIIKHLHPEMTIDDSKGESVEEWLQKVEEAVTALNDSSVATSELESQNSQLQSLIQHYKTIITETEGMLNQLQSQVEVEESRWKEKLLTLEEELDLLKLHNLNKC